MPLFTAENDSTLISAGALESTIADNFVPGNYFPMLDIFPPGTFSSMYPCGGIVIGPPDAPTALTINRMILAPFMTPFGAKLLTRFKTHVTVAAAAGSIIRMGIYDTAINSSGYYRPNKLLFDSGDLDGSTTGQKSVAPLIKIDRGIPTLLWAAYRPTVVSPTPTILAWTQSKMMSPMGFETSDLTQQRNFVLSTSSSTTDLPSTPGGELLDATVLPGLFVSYTR